MNRTEFMKELEKELSNLPEEEKDEALQYYEDYFEDAGKEAEGELIEKLGSPRKLADSIKEGLKEKEKEAGEYTERGYFEEKDRLEDLPEKQKRKGNHPFQKTWVKILLIVLVVIGGIVVGSPIIMSAIGILLGLFFGVFGILFGGFVGSLACGIVGFIMSIVGIGAMFVSPVAGIHLLGVGLILLGIGIAVFSIFLFLCLWAFPLIFRWVVSLVRKPFYKDKGKEEKQA